MFWKTAVVLYHFRLLRSTSDSLIDKHNTENWWKRPHKYSSVCANDKTDFNLFVGLVKCEWNGCTSVLLFMLLEKVSEYELVSRSYQFTFLYECVIFNNFNTSCYIWLCRISKKNLKVTVILLFFLNFTLIIKLKRDYFNFY